MTETTWKKVDEQTPLKDLCIRRTEYCNQCQKRTAIKAFPIDGNRWTIPVQTLIDTLSGCCNSRVTTLYEIVPVVDVFAIDQYKDYPKTIKEQLKMCQDLIMATVDEAAKEKGEKKEVPNEKTKEAIHEARERVKVVEEPPIWQKFRRVLKSDIGWGDAGVDDFFKKVREAKE